MSSFHFLARLFRSESAAIVITRLLLLSSCKNFNLAYYSKSIKVINTRIKLAYHDKVQLRDKGHNSERYVFGVMSLFNLKF